MASEAELRKVSPKRKRKLVKKGHAVWWSVELNSYVWQPKANR